MSESKQPRALTSTPNEATILADLERYRGYALSWGASDTAVISASEVKIDARVRLKCTVPRCLRAGETPNCPPYAPDLDLVREALNQFNWALLIKCNVEPIEAYRPRSGVTKEEKRRTLSFHQQSGEVVYKLERQAYADGYHLAMGFGGGSCKDYLCQGMICQFLDSGRCRFPHRARPAMEAMGIDVIALLDQVGWQAYPMIDELSEIPCAVTIGIVFLS
jgi:predicted metal-binding protein